MIRGDGFGGLLDLRCDGAVVLLKVLGVLQDAVEVFLSREGYIKPPLLLNSRDDMNRNQHLLLPTSL